MTELSVIWYGILQLCGIALSFCVFPENRRPVRIWLGSVLGSLMAIWSPVPFAFFTGFTVCAHLLGIAVCILLTIGLCLFGKRKAAPIPETEPSDLPLLVLLPVFFLLSMVILLNHTIPEGKAGLYTGQCTYGDMSMHLGFITSIANQGTFPPYYSILPSEKLCYPFLCDSISASFYLVGVSLRWAYILPMLPALLQVFAGVWFLASDICRSRKAAILAFLFFFLCGGFGLWYFLNGDYSFGSIFTGYYTTPTNLTDRGIRWVNVIADMLIPQRATLFGWAALTAVLWLLYRAVFCEEDRYWLPAGILGGLLPMIHTHSYFALGLIALGWMICSVFRERSIFIWMKKWCLFGLPAVCIAVPQLLEWTLQSVSGNSAFLKISPDWVNMGQENFLLFWLKNIGPLFVVIPAAFFLADRNDKMVCSGAVLIFALGEIFTFQPNPYDNNKLFYIAYLFFCFLAADALVRAGERIGNRAVRGIAGALLVLLCTNAAVLTLGRELISGTEQYHYLLFSSDDVKACAYIEEHTEADSTFLTADNHNNAVAVLTGRNIVCGSTCYVYYHGLDYGYALEKEKEMLASPQVFESCREEFGIDYVYIGPYELAQSHALSDYLQEQYPCEFQSGNVSIYRITG